MTTGKIIFLNGTSSAGKTALATTLQKVLHEPYMHFSLDTFLQMLLGRYANPAPQASPVSVDEAALLALFPTLMSGMHRCMATLATAGINLIIDHVLQDPAWLAECVALLADFPVWFVGVRCPLDELERRERERDREPGTAQAQFDVVHAHAIYDVEVDTSRLSPAECAARIQEVLQSGQPPEAFVRLRQNPASDSG